MAVTEKRQLDETVYSTKHIVLDIEGTTTSISFVKDTLFPYVRKNLDGYINSHWTEEEFKDVLALLKNQAAEDVKAAMEGAIEIPSDGSDDDVKAAIAKSVLWQMDSDRKTTALKKLQGQMWRQGYKTGELKGHVFADVAPSLKEWVKDGRKLYVYSSGSVEAQKLLFGNSTEGDLTELFTDFFDTEVGAKVDVESYKSIVKKLDCKADDVLFLTDLPKEASAAREAGLPVILVEREGNEAIANELRKEFSAVSSFQELAFESSSKKQKVEGDSNVGKVDDNKTADASVMEVDPAEKPEEKTEAKDVEAEPMDVDKQDVEPVKEAETAAENKIEVKIEENGSSVVDRKEEIEVKKAEVTETKPDTEVKEVSDISVKEAEPSESVKAEEKISEVKKDATPETVEKEKVTEKTDVVVPDEKTEEQDTEKVETESGNAEPKEDTKTEDNKSEPETVKEVEESQVEKKEDTVKETVEVKNETEKEIAADVDTKKEDDSDKVSVKEIPEEKEVIETETKEIAPETEVSKETNETEDTKSVKAEEKTASVESETKVEAEQKGDLEDKEKVNGTSNGTSNGISNGTTNGNSNGTANGAKEADTNGTVENGHSKLEKEGIPEVIVAKNTTQIENGSADAAVVVEA